MTKHPDFKPSKPPAPPGTTHPPPANYKLLVSAIVPRPIALISTRRADGAENLAPFSYFNVVGHDPPLYVVGFTSDAGPNAKHTLRNAIETGEAVINIISETFAEAANASSIDAPYGVSEWPLTGLTPLHDCQTVSCPRVKEAVFSIEVKLDSYKEYESRATPGKKSSTVVTFEGTRFWVRDDATDESKTLVDPSVLRPMSRLGGISYARVTEVLELQRPKYQDHLDAEKAKLMN
ncbi:FMN-binding split barrel [Ophiocordyceps camponoti-floridani]|uniref:FMN-binding split barrel n=1 Tax=Ophiocordyceps camponoti-floridani TaxID=2030778 RepID=A0A8H4VAM8_9HYPO|nr:FMN-binding split barrel [Ophiocordyceps camponoti-floridani]